MKKLLLIIYSILLTTFASFAQPWGQLKQGEMAIGSKGNDIGNYIMQTNDGGYLLVGNMDSGAYVVKLNGSGYSPWNKIIQTKKVNYTIPAGNSIIQTKDGGYTMVGSDNRDSIYIIRLDTNGNIAWSRSITQPNLIGAGASSLILTKDGGYLITGFIQPNSGAFSPEYALIAKLDSSGYVKWIWTYYGGGWVYNTMNSAVETTDGSYVCLGTLQNNSVVFKLDSNGNSVWSRKIRDASVEAITKTNDNGFALTGNIGMWNSVLNKWFSNVYLLKLDSVGHMEWSRAIGGDSSDYGRSITQAKDGGYIMGGNTNSFGAGAEDVYIIKVDTSGRLQWTQTVGGTGDDYCNSIVSTKDGGCAIAGSTTSYGSGGNDMYFIKLDSAGGLCTGIFNNGKVTAIDTGIVVDTTYTFSSLASSPDAVVGFVETYGATFTKICSVVSVNNLLQPNGLITVSPNPSNGKFTFQWSVTSSQLTVEIYNVLGEKVYDKALRLPDSYRDQGDYEIDLSSQPAGVYFYRVLSGSKFVGNGKLIIEK